MTIERIYKKLNANYEEVLSRFKTDERIEKYLNKLIQIEDFENVRMALEENDYAEAFRYTHNLKGMSINMGIESLETISHAMCQVLRNGAPVEDVWKYFDRLEEEYINIRNIVLGARNKVLIIDDAEFNREILEEILDDEYTVLLAEDGKSGIELLEQNNKEIRVILLDLIMPNTDGYEVLRIMEEKGYMKEIPVLVISSEQAVDVKKRCFEYGVSDFISKPFDDIIVKKRVKDTVDLFMYRKKFGEHLYSRIETSKNRVCSDNKTELLQKTNDQLREMLYAIIDGRNPESPEHIDNVKRYTVLISKQLMKDYPEYGITEKMIRIFEEASTMHDIGKISIPDDILNKPGKLTKEEFECIKGHTVKGCEILEQIGTMWDDEFRKTVYDICKYHHERYDGKGYPEGLKDEEIPLSAQIVAIAEVYDALINNQSYREAISGTEAYDMIVNGECGTFSPKLIDVFSKIFK